ncbi:MAG: hypothetical protein KDE58_34355 [Caldilineaceae bacterium]|nr:hypothetical protein [Caldilineaceae bacterium]
MKRSLIALYGLIAYAVGMGGLVYFILFVGGWSFLPVHVNAGTPGPLWRALLINLGIILLFGVQHSVMARPTFKRQFTKLVPKAAERSTYVLLSGVMMLIISFGWQPLAGTIWQVDNPVGRLLLTVGYALGWMLAVVSTFVINHFELFGLQQVYLNLRNQPEPAPWFTDRFLYRMVRHPLQLGILIGIWVVPTMSMSLLFLSAAMTVYIFIGLYFEEKDLVASLGKEYLAYKQRVPKVLPFPRPASQAADSEADLVPAPSASGD